MPILPRSKTEPVKSILRTLILGSPFLALSLSAQDNDAASLMATVISKERAEIPNLTALRSLSPLR